MREWFLLLTKVKANYQDCICMRKMGAEWLMTGDNDIGFIRGEPRSFQKDLE